MIKVAPMISYFDNDSTSIGRKSSIFLPNKKNYTTKEYQQITLIRVVLVKIEYTILH